jgi:hypothetical protein
MSLFQLLGIGNRNHADVASADVATEQEPEFAVPSQARSDKQKDGIATKDVSGGTNWTLTEAEALNKVLRPTGQDGSYKIIIPENGLYVIDLTDGSDASGNDATVETVDSGNSITLSDGHHGIVLANGGSVAKLDMSA